ncbi:hypothetical protein AVEN_70295-1, partial [Araneus ventricosus]
DGVYFLKEPIEKQRDIFQTAYSDLLVAQRVNSTPGVHKRRMIQLQGFYQNLERRAMKKKAGKRVDIYKIGGGPSTSHLGPTEERLIAMGVMRTPRSNLYDDDQWYHVMTETPPPQLPADNSFSDFEVYTDGSRIEDETGFAVCIFQENNNIENHLYKLKSHNSVFQAELAAIHCAANWAASKNVSINIHTDSLSSIAAIKSASARSFL